MELKGEIKNVIFRSEDTGYTVVDLKVEESVFTVVGIFPPVSEGQNLRVEGTFKVRTMYGKQFAAEKIYPAEPTKLDGIKRFLGSGLIKGLGKATAEAIVDMYGINALEMMKYPIELAKVRGISLKKATEFGINYAALQKMQSAVIFLQDLGISINTALKIYRAYGDKTEANVRKNPYMLVDDIDGIGFQTADKIAEELGIEHNGDYRISAAVIHTLKEAMSKQGHNYLPENELIMNTNALLSLDCEEPLQRIADNINDMVLFDDLVKYNAAEHVAVMLKRNFIAETNIARRLYQLQNEAALFVANVDYEVKRFESEEGITLHENQSLAVKEAVENGVHIITGGPGTGKTTIVKCVIRMMKNLRQRVALCAPTGRAAKRLSEATGEDARTIHRLLGLDWKGGESFFLYNENNTLPYDVVIIDEVSMVDEAIFNSLLRALERGARLVLVGDKDQLASVGAGNVLSDLIKCGRFTVTCLTQIYRQSDKSKIVPNAHKINKGEMPELDNKSSDFFFEEREGAEQILSTTLSLVTKRLPDYLKIKPIDVQVLCPMKRGSAGTNNLNAKIQNAINPPSPLKKEFRHGETVFREGDKIMQTQNDYQQEWTQIIGNKSERGTGVYNGDIGYIESVNTQIMQFSVRFDDDKVAVYQYANAEQLALAYAVTIHKSQGSEFDAVVIALDANYMLQTRNLLYTAVTRAKKTVVIVGSRGTVARMIRNNETARRYSLLINLIEEQFG